jgi:hypothetical protein
LKAEIEALGLRKGEKCTKFFHQMVNSNKRNNPIESLLVNGTDSSDHIENIEVIEHIVQFYNSLFSG